MFKKYLFLFLLTQLFSNNLYSQNEYENLNFINIKEGFSKRAVSTIIQDHYGFIWFGTNGAGLYKYDGVNYTTYEYNWNNDASINSNLIYCTYVDSNKRLWVGTDDGLNLYNRDLDKFERIDLQSVFSVVQNENIRVKSLKEDDSGNLIIGIASYGYGLLKLSLNNLNISRVLSSSEIKEGFIINNLTKDKNGKIYIATNIGLLEFDQKNNLVKESKFYNGKFDQKISEQIISLLVDFENNLWLTTDNKGIFKISLIDKINHINHFPLTQKPILSIIELEKGTLLCGTENGGLLLINSKGNLVKNLVYDKFDKYSLSSNSIWSLYLDNEKRIWLGYYNMGIGVFDKNFNKFNKFESITNNTNSLQVSSVTGIIKDATDKFWISMDGGGVDIYNPKTKIFEHINSSKKSIYSGLKGDDIQTVFIDSHQNIWLGSWTDGIYLLKPGSKKFINFNKNNTNEALSSNRILSIAEDSKGIIWIGTFTKGLHYYIPKENKIIYCNSESFNNSGINNFDVRKVLVDSHDNIWVGTTNGLFKVIKNADNSFTIKSMKEKMSEKLINHTSTHHILSLYEAKNGILWIGTDGGGLFSYNQIDDTINWYNTIEGFKEKSVCSIIESEFGEIWVSGKSGITKLDLNTNKAINFTIDDGLLANDYNNNAVFKDQNNNLYFGNYLGLNYFNPDNIPTNTAKSTLHLTDFKLFNKHVEPNTPKSPLKKTISETNNLTLNHNQSVFTIEYIGINYTRPEKNNYAYFLEGFETDWNYVGNTKNATYTNLPPGNYTFKVKSSNNDGVWNNEPLNLKIQILPPWWKSNLAFFSYFIIFILTFLGLNTLLQKRFKEKQASQLERNKRLQEEKLHDKKLQFFTNISHEFRTPLTLIKTPLEDLINDEKIVLPQSVKEKHRIIYKNSNRLSRLIDELMDFRKLQSNKILIQAQIIDIVDYTKSIVSYFDEESSHRKIKLNFSSSTKNLNSWVDPGMFEKIIFNILSNAFKVTPDNGSIDVAINTNEDTKYLPLVSTEKTVKVFEITINDTGIGINKKEINKIFERFYQISNLNNGYYGSTGIGLELVKDFVELHKGTIAVESELGKGTKFTITFPLGKDHFSENEISNIKSELQSVQVETVSDLSSSKNLKDLDSKNKTHTLLIVEDNVELRNYLKIELGNYYKIIDANNGKKGLELAIEKLPDIILTDVVMPVMNGLELCKNIKSNIKTSHIPLLMLTAKTMIEDKLEGIDSGADGYMSKPFNMELLKSKLTQLLTSRQILFNKYYNGITKDSKVKTTTVDNLFIQKVLAYVNNNISESNLSVELLASKLFLSRSQLYRKINSLTGLTASEFIRNVRLEKAKQLLESGDNNIGEVAYRVGFSSPSYFTKCFKNHFGHLPNETSF